MRVSIVAPTFVLLAGLSFPALAGDDGQATPTTAASAPATAPTDQTSDLDTVVCKKFAPPTGTRLGSRTICDTKRHWQQLQQQSQQELQKMQNGAAPAGPGAGG